MEASLLVAHFWAVLVVFCIAFDFPGLHEKVVWCAVTGCTHAQTAAQLTSKALPLTIAGTTRILQDTSVRRGLQCQLSCEVLHEAGHEASVKCR